MALLYHRLHIELYLRGLPTPFRLPFSYVLLVCAPLLVCPGPPRDEQAQRLALLHPDVAAASGAEGGVGPPVAAVGIGIAGATAEAANFLEMRIDDWHI